MESASSRALPVLRDRPIRGDLDLLFLALSAFLNRPSYSGTAWFRPVLGSGLSTLLGLDLLPSTFGGFASELTDAGLCESGDFLRFS